MISAQLASLISKVMFCWQSRVQEKYELWYISNVKNDSRTSTSGKILSKHTSS